MDSHHMGHDHGDTDMGGHQCNMNMLFTWDTTDLCIIFESWHVHSTASLLFALIGVVILTAGYELVREMSRKYEAGLQTRVRAAESSRRNARESERNSQVIKALFYSVQVFYSFFIMLLFMTYNGWVMFAVAVGAFVGYLLFGQSSATKTVACH